MSLPEASATAASPAQQENSEKRLQQRVAINCQLNLCWQDPDGNRVLRVRAIDISKFGILVEAERAIRPGTAVSVQTVSMVLGTACVRHCTPKGLKFRIGLRLPDCLIRHP
jgi:hypothetical protein